MNARRLLSRIMVLYQWFAGHAERGGLKFVATFAGGAIIVTVALNVAAPAAVGVAVVPGSGGDIVAFEPGSGFNVAAYCRSAKTVTIANTPGAEVIGTKRVARNSDLDYIDWLDNNANTSAVRFYVDKQGKPQHETVDVEGAVACMRAQR